jgi:ribosome biogenesis GTPase
VKEGLIVKVTGNVYTVRVKANEYINCYIKGNLRIKGLKSTNPVTVGDRVVFSYNPGDEKGVIYKVLDRTNYIIRKATNLSKQYHIIASNVDQAILTVTITEPSVSTEFIDRYLVTCEAFSVPCILIFNKTDLCTGPYADQLNELIGIYSSIGYQCLKTSVKTGQNIDQLKNLMANKISVINGQSGVGKSSLIKTIAPNIDLKIGGISEYHKLGTHTTSYSEMYEIFDNTFIIDTPGIKGFGLVDIEKNELYHFFPEIFKISDQCKYYNCTHIHEPDCAVVEAVRNGSVALSRYKSYINIYFDENEKYRNPY